MSTRVGLQWRQRFAGTLVGGAAVALGLAAALMRWSAWWPHRDIRQYSADRFTAVGFMVGLLALAAGVRRLAGPRRLVAMTLAVFATTAVALVAYEALINYTIEQR